MTALWRQQVAVRVGLEKEGQMVQRDDNGAISQRILHLWRDGGCCRGLLMPAEINAMDEHISYWQPPYHCWLSCLDTYSGVLWKQTLQRHLCKLEKVKEKALMKNSPQNIWMIMKLAKKIWLKKIVKEV